MLESDFCRGGCAVMGLSGTFVGRNLIASTGLISTGIMATAFQALVLCGAAIIYHLHLAPAAVVQVCPVSLSFCLQGIEGLFTLWVTTICSQTSVCVMVQAKALRQMFPTWVMTRQDIGCKKLNESMRVRSTSILQVGGEVAVNSMAGPVILGAPAFTWCFCLLIVLSRIGIWTFDMVNCQVFQMVSMPFRHLHASLPSSMVSGVSQYLSDAPVSRCFYWGQDAEQARLPTCKDSRQAIIIWQLKKDKSAIL